MADQEAKTLAKLVHSDGVAIADEEATRHSILAPSAYISHDALSCS
jgi:hypothetical protein